MNKEIKEVLNKIEEKGFIAYIVGGYVRDYLLNIETKDIDLCTNATPKDLQKIFNNDVKTYEEYGAVKLHLKNSVIDITTFRRELEYENGKPTLIEYTSSLESDLLRRDFKINTLCMDKNLNIIDLLEGRSDLNNRIINTVKPVDISFTEDPSRILRSIRFMNELNFNLNNEIIEFIKFNKELIKKINPVKKKEELEKLFLRGNVTRFLRFIKEYELEEVLGIKAINYKETDNIIGVWSQLEVDASYSFTKNEKNQIKKVKELLKKGNIEIYDLYKYGLFCSSVAGNILGISKKNINLMYTSLPIKGIIDINIKSEEICEILGIGPSKKLGIIIKVLEREIVEGRIENTYEKIKEKLITLR